MVSKFDKGLLIFTVLHIIAAVLIVSYYSKPHNPASAAPPAHTCPAGTYEIGREGNYPICKNEPTGCPYGDSIPVDSPKCAPPTNPNAYDRWQPEQPVEQLPEVGGK